MTIELAAWKYEVRDLPIRVLVTGESGSGKSVIIKKVKFGMARDGVVIYDVDNADSAVEEYEEKCKGVPVRAISMRYTDGVGIDFASLITTGADRQRFALKIIPDVQNDSAPFWNRICRVLLRNAMKALHILAPGKALLADVVRVCFNPALQEHISVSAGLGNPYGPFGDNDSKRDAVVTLMANLEDLTIFAAVDMHCKERITLPLQEGVLVLEWSDTYGPALSGIYSFLLDTCAEVYLSENRTMPVCYVVDEFRQLQKLQCIEDIARRGRKSALSLILSMHEISGVHDRYGADRAEELLGLLNHKLFLKIGSPKTAKWASDYCGTVEVLESIFPRSTDGSGKNYGQRVTMRPNVLPDEFRHVLKPASYENDMVEGYADFPNEVRKFESKFRDAVSMPEERNEMRLRRSEEDQNLPPLSSGDLVRLNVPVNRDVLEMLK